MSDEPLITPDDLGTYLDNSNIKTDRAAMMIGQAQDACQQIVNPIPAEKMFVLYRVAARAYTATTTTRSYQLGQSDSEFTTPGPVTGVYLTEYDRMDLLGDEETSAPEAFTIRLTPPQRSGPLYQGIGYGGCW